MINPKYVIQTDVRKQVFDEGKLVFDGINLDAERIGQPCNVLISFVTEAHVHGAKWHSHDFPQIFGIFGTNPQNYDDFDAEIEAGLDGEINTITKPSFIYLPAGVEHGPLAYKRIGKPIIFLEIMLTRKYTKKVINK
jgi:hypothetical protein